MNIQKIETIIDEFEKMVPTLRRMLNALPEIKQIISAAKVFSVAAQPRNSHVVEDHDESENDISSTRTFNDIVLNIMNENPDAKWRNHQIEKICLDRGLIRVRDKKRIGYTTYYMANRAKVKTITGNAVDGYTVIKH